MAGSLRHRRLASHAPFDLSPVEFSSRRYARMWVRAGAGSGNKVFLGSDRCRQCHDKERPADLGRF